MSEHTRRPNYWKYYHLGHSSETSFIIDTIANLVREQGLGAVYNAPWAPHLHASFQFYGSPENLSDNMIRRIWNRCLDEPEAEGY